MRFLSLYKAAEFGCIISINDKIINNLLRWGAISTKFCMVIEVVRAIILGVKLFWLPSIVLPPRGVENLAEIAPIEVNC